MLSQEPEISSSNTVLVSQFSLVLLLLERRRKYWIWFRSFLSHVRWIFDGVFVHFQIKYSAAREKGQDFLKIRTPTHHAPWQHSYDSRASRTDPVWPLLGKPTLYTITVMCCNISFASVLSSLPHMVHLIRLCRGAVRRYGAARLARLWMGHQIRSFSKYHMVKHLQRTPRRK